MQIILHAEVLQEHLQLLQERLLNMEEPMLEIGHIVSQFIEANFATADWPPLSPETIRLKESLGYPTDPLIRTGKMFTQAALSEEWQVSRAGRGWVAKLEVPGYSAFHFSGTRFMPARDYALLPDSIEGYVLAILEAHLFAGMTG